ncbi:MAG: hypothetical protein R3Y44_01425 [Rikenellaceae bacterium]
MDISQLEKSIAQLSTERGYTPLIASEQELEGAQVRFPAAWIQLPMVLYVEGRDEGVICHKIVVGLLDDYSSYSFDDKSDRLNQMHDDALEIMTALSRVEGVVEINDLTITPRVTHLTRHGDVSQICQASVVSYF